MNSKYKTIKYKKNKPSNIEDLVSIEEPLEMVVRYKKENESRKKLKEEYLQLKISTNEENLPLNHPESI